MKCENYEIQIENAIAGVNRDYLSEPVVKKGRVTISFDCEKTGTTCNRINDALLAEHMRVIVQDAAVQ